MHYLYIIYSEKVDHYYVCESMDLERRLARVFDLGDDGKPAPALFLSFEMLPYFITHLMGHIHQYPSTGS